MVETGKYVRKIRWCDYLYKPLALCLGNPFGKLNQRSHNRFKPNSNFILELIKPVSTCMHVSVCRCCRCLWVSACVWLCWSYQNLVMPHQCARIKRRKAGPLVGLWFMQTRLTYSRLGWEKNENPIVFVRVIHEPKPQCVLCSPLVPYVKQFKRRNTKDGELFFLASFPHLSLYVLGKEIEVSSSVSRQGVFSWNSLLLFFLIGRLVFSPSDSLQRN